MYRYPGLTIKYVRGKDPIIKLLDEDDDVVEELAIDKWNTDSVEEFLSTYIEYCVKTWGTIIYYFIEDRSPSKHKCLSFKEVIC